VLSEGEPRDAAVNFDRPIRIDSVVTNTSLKYLNTSPYTAVKRSI